MTVLIAGAGPTGLATALFLARANQQVRIIDKLREPANYSKAMALNPRSLDLLEECGATSALLAEGNILKANKISDRPELSFSSTTFRLVRSRSFIVQIILSALALPL